MFNILEITQILQWWAAFFTIGIIFLPLTTLIFNSFLDRGYLFSKVLGLGLISYVLLVANVLHVLPFGLVSIVLISWFFIIGNFLLFKKNLHLKKLPWRIIIFEEFIFLLGIFAWSFVRGHEPSLNGLEKFMDFGFLNSILRTTYQPAVDMWFPPLPINYYYFGHLYTAVATKLSFLQSNISYNLMIATLFSFCFSLTFSLGANLISKAVNKKAIIGGLLAAMLVSFSGNLHTIYAFFKAYNVDSPVPFWNLQLLINSFPNSYWYPNATRFIPFTIHEFPLYSFIVSDLHGHVLDIPFVLLAIATSFVLFKTKDEAPKVIKILGIKIPFTNYNSLIVFISLLLAIMYMTNVWDGLIYMLLVFLVIFIKNWNRKKILNSLGETAKSALFILILFFLFSLPFNFFFKPFASGVGVLCAPDFLTSIGKIGPFLFEKDHCQRSLIWQLATLYGFFYFLVISFFVFLWKKGKNIKIEESDIYVAVLIVLSTLLIIVPEFLYVKDIYPQHYRANTMFKLVYQAFIMLSLCSGYIIVRILTVKKYLLFIVPSIILLGLVFSYPYFSISSYYGDLKNYSGIDGTAYLETKYPQDYASINWINKYISGSPVILEAQGDSYTDYARISANTGLPTVLGWTVHEWLWRGTYDIPAPRIAEVQNIYTSKDLELTKTLLKKHNVKYVYIGGLEREKYPTLTEDKFGKLGKIVFQNGTTKIYKLSI